MYSACTYTYIIIQASSAGVNQLLASVISAGVEGVCNCGFSTNNLIQIILQCFPDNPEKINVLLLLQETPNSNISQIITFMNTWINTDPYIILDENNTTVTIDSDCDIEIIQGSECTTGTQTPPPTMPQSTPTSSSIATYNDTTTEPTDPSFAQSSQSKGQDLTTVGGVLLGIAIIIIVISIVIIFVVLIRKRVIKIGSFKM